MKHSTLFVCSPLPFISPLNITIESWCKWKLGPNCLNFNYYWMFLLLLCVCLSTLSLSACSICLQWNKQTVQQQIAIIPLLSLWNWTMWNSKTFSFLPLPRIVQSQSVVLCKWNTILPLMVFARPLKHWNYPSFWQGFCTIFETEKFGKLNGFRNGFH